MPDLKELPKSITLSGGAFNSARPGNGLWFDHDGLAELTKAMKGGAFVANHDRGVEAAAGIINAAGAERNRVRLNFYKVDREDKTKQHKITKRVTATRLTYHAELHEDFPAYEKVARSILARHERGVTPHVSIAVWASGLGFDEETETFHLLAPYKFLHLGHVDHGAQTPDDGVGVERVFMSAGTSEMTFDLDGKEVKMQADTEVHVANMPDLVADFAAEFSDRPEIVENLGTLLGMDSEADSPLPVHTPSEEEDNAWKEAEELDVIVGSDYSVKVERTVKSNVPTSNSTQLGNVWVHVTTTTGTPVDVNTSGAPWVNGLDKGSDSSVSYTIPEEQEIEGHQAQVDEVSQNTNSVTPDSPPKDVGAPPAPTLDADKFVSADKFEAAMAEIQAMKEKLAKEEEARMEAEKAEIEALRRSIAAEFGKDVEALAVFTTKAALLTYKNDLESAREVVPHIGDHASLNSEDVDPDEAERLQWLESLGAKHGIGGGN